MILKSLLHIKWIGVLLRFSFITFSLTSYSQDYREYYENPEVDSYINQSLEIVSADSIESFIQHLQDYGTRDALNPNRKEIAQWIKSKYESWGYETILDSFMMVTYQGEMAMQYNVVAERKGSADSTKIYCIGGHYDSVNNPGAEDNASGNSVTMEVARAMQDITPCYTIRFMAFAAEEYGLFGSEYLANKYRNNEDNIVFMLNNDMVAYDPDSNNTVNGINYPRATGLFNYFEKICSKYTNLNYINDNGNYKRSDSYSFYLNDFSSIFFASKDFSPYYHQQSDTIGHLNMAFCANITKLNMAMFLHDFELPENYNFKFQSDCNSITLNWDNLSKAISYNLYRSTAQNGDYVQINETPITETAFIDEDVIQGQNYWYLLSSKDESGIERKYSLHLSASTFCPEEGILVIDASNEEGTNIDDDDIDLFYENLLTEYQTTVIEISEDEHLSFGDISNYSTIIWHNERRLKDIPFINNFEPLKKYMDAGGNLFLTRYSPNDFSFEKNRIIRNYLKVDSVFGSGFLNKAVTSNSNYISLNIDSSKIINTLMHLSYVTPFTIVDDAEELFTFENIYDSSSYLGKNNGATIGVGYFGGNYKMVNLYFPLYFMNFTQSKTFTDYILQEKFHETLSVKEVNIEQIFKIYPNPNNGAFTIQLNEPLKSDATIEIINVNGQIVSKGMIRRNAINQRLDFVGLPKGLYVVKIYNRNISLKYRFIVEK